MERGNLCYDVSPYQRHLWRYHKLVEPSAREAERSGEERYEAFPDFAGEVFHRLYADEAKPLDPPVDGSDVFSVLHEQIGKIPEFDDLVKRCQGDERWAGIGTSAMLDTLLTSVDHPDNPVEDIRGDANAMAYLEALRDRTKEPERQEAIDESLEQLRAEHQQRQQAAQQAAQQMDVSQVRNAVRQAAAAANDAIDEEERMVDSFCGGTAEHGGRQARQQASKQLASMVKDNERLQQIAELAGRLRRIAIQQQQDKPRRGTDEVTGIELGAEFGRLLPSEMLWADEPVEMVFAGKLYERALLQTELHKVPPKQQGPIVVVLDSSGSMQYNHADTWAAAVTLAFLEIARRQNRPFAIVHFGYSVLRVDRMPRPKQAPLQQVLDAVGFFAGDGGTNFMDSLDEAVSIIEKEGDYKEADIVMITDGCASVSDSWLAAFQRKQEQLEFSTYSILVGGSTRADTNERFSDDVVHLDSVLRDDEAMHRFFGKV